MYVVPLGVVRCFDLMPSIWHYDEKIIFTMIIKRSVGLMSKTNLGICSCNVAS